MKYLILLAFLDYASSQETIGGGYTKSNLFDYVKSNYKTNSTLGYSLARDVMYSEIDIQDGGILKGIYTDYSIVLDLSQDPSSNAYEQDINCEHSWPQSMGSGSEPQKSDIHHLYPSRVNVNSARGNKPYGEIEDQNTDRWYRFDIEQSSIPNQNLNEYSEVDFGGDRFEPREDVKGNIARSMFYFYTIYNEIADEEFFQQQIDALYEWHKNDIVDFTELNRTYQIASYQDNIANPFVIDSSLVRRIWYFECYDDVTSDDLLSNLLISGNYDFLLDINSDGKTDLVDLIFSISRDEGQDGYFICD